MNFTLITWWRNIRYSPISIFNNFCLCHRPYWSTGRLLHRFDGYYRLSAAILLQLLLRTCRCKSSPRWRAADADLRSDLDRIHSHWWLYNFPYAYTMNALSAWITSTANRTHIPIIPTRITALHDNENNSCALMEAGLIRNKSLLI